MGYPGTSYNHICHIMQFASMAQSYSNRVILLYTIANPALVGSLPVANNDLHSSRVLYKTKSYVMSFHYSESAHYCVGNVITAATKCLCRHYYCH